MRLVDNWFDFGTEERDQTWSKKKLRENAYNGEYLINFYLIKYQLNSRSDGWKYLVEKNHYW